MSLSRILVGMLLPFLALLLLAGVPAQSGQCLDAAGIVRPDDSKGGAFILAQVGVTTDEDRWSGIAPAGDDTPDPHAVAAVLPEFDLVPSTASSLSDLADAPPRGARLGANPSTGPPASI